ncbi:hypothetical protein T492DRAFT_837217 [Pavlovales sp. CCMP2436]|nr:hypothetical protein T492DRAFT_837217 [Pavlovales sp. CCMP2436]
MSHRVSDQVLASAWCYREPLLLPTGANGSPWEPDCDEARCRQAGCRKYMTVGQRHHCRRCGLLFCERHTSWRSTVPEQGHSMRTCFGCAIEDFTPDPLTGSPPILSPPAVPLPLPPADALEFDVTLRMYKARLTLREPKKLHVHCSWGASADESGALTSASALVWCTASAKAAQAGAEPHSGGAAHAQGGGTHAAHAWPTGNGQGAQDCLTVRWRSVRHFGAAVRRDELESRVLVLSVRADGVWFVPAQEVGTVRLSLLQLATGPPNYNMPILDKGGRPVGRLSFSIEMQQIDVLVCKLRIAVSTASLALVRQALGFGVERVRARLALVPTLSKR